MLRWLEWRWLGVFIAPTTNSTVGEVVYRWAHRTVRCATRHCLVRQPRHPTVRVLKILTVGAQTSCHTEQSGMAPDRCCSLSGVPLTLALTSVRIVHALFTLLQTTVVLDSRCSAGPPDSLVNYSGATLEKLKGEEFESIAPGAPDSPVCQTRVLFGFFCSFLLNHNFDLFIGLC
jgi:hypothetical protein